jgi:hypothetical protein
MYIEIKEDASVERKRDDKRIELQNRGEDWNLKVAKV